MIDRFSTLSGLDTRFGYNRDSLKWVDGFIERQRIAADVYSDGLAEEIVGQALGGRRDRVLISTKARFEMGPGPNDAGLSRHHLVEAC